MINSFRMIGRDLFRHTKLVRVETLPKDVQPLVRVMSRMARSDEDYSLNDSLRSNTFLIFVMLIRYFDRESIDLGNGITALWDFRGILNFYKDDVIWSTITVTGKVITVEGNAIRTVELNDLKKRVTYWCHLAMEAWDNDRPIRDLRIAEQELLDFFNPNQGDAQPRAEAINADQIRAERIVVNNAINAQVQDNLFRGLANEPVQWNVRR